MDIKPKKWQPLRTIKMQGNLTNTITLRQAKKVNNLWPFRYQRLLTLPKLLVNNQACQLLERSINKHQDLRT